MCVAPITDAFIRGLDFLVNHECVVNLRNYTLAIGDEALSASLMRNHVGEIQKICRVTLQRNTVVPTKSRVVTVGKVSGVLHKAGGVLL